MILGITIAYIIGILGGLIQEIFVVVPFFIALILINKKIRRYLKCMFKKQAIIYIIVFIIGLVHITMLESNFKNRYTGVSELNVIATIVSNGKEEEYKNVYIIKIEEGKYKNTKLLLNVKKNNNISLKYGDKVYIQGEFEKPNDARNYGGFSYKEYLKTKKIYGTVTCNTLKVIDENNVNIINRIANNLSNKIISNIQKLLPQEEAGLLTGLLIGNKDNISEETIENFKNSNLSHMLAISGAHISYIILGATTLLNSVKISKRASKIIMIILLVFFMILVGASPSVVRACIMAIYTIVGSVIYKKTNIVANISVSLLIIAIDNPYSIFDIGCQLSYGGTIGIILFAKILDKVKNKQDKSSEGIVKKLLNYIKQMIIVSISANIIIIPIMAYNFNTISLTFCISNVLATPILGVSIILGFICIISSFIFMPVAQMLSFILKICLKILIQIANISSKIPFSKIYVKTPSIIFIVAYYVCIFIFLRLISKRKKYIFERKLWTKIKALNYKKLILVFMVILIIVQTIKIFPQNLKIYFIDVGQGDSTLIVSPYGKKILIDGGGSKDENSFNVGEQILLPYLLDRRINKIDYCIISHFDSDHVGGILTILESIKVKNVIISKQGENSENYKEFLRIVKQKNIKVIVVKKGSTIKIDKDTHIKILWPKEEQIGENILNNNSIVAKITCRNFTMLFTGDIEQIAEDEIVKECANTNELRSTLLKVAHHGSKGSSMQEFINLVKPKISLIGVGAKNTFGHPSQQVIEKLENVGSIIYRTDKMGEIVIEVTRKGKINIKTKIN